MNVGSILNKESPPSDLEHPTSAPEFKDSGVPIPRHSIVNILNNPPSSITTHTSNTTSSNALPFQSPVVSSAVPIQQKEFTKPISPTVSNNSPTLPRPIKRNSIANITNDRDVDIATGRETSINISRHSSFNDMTKEAEDQKPTITASDLDEAIASEDTKISKENDLKAKKEVDELARLKKIRNSSKPRRYETPPIWAQEWIPPNRQHLHQQNNISSNISVGNGNEVHHQSVLSEKRVFDYSSTTSVDLECSITGVIPPPSVTRTIAEWIFANFRDIAEHNRKYVELELKFGTIVDKSRGHRINLNVTTECIYTDHTNVFFDMQVDEKAWQDINKYFQELENIYQDELKKMNVNTAKTKPKRKFNTLDEDITDNFFQVGKPGEQPKSVRVSKDNTLNPPRYTGIEKQRISDLFIHNPSSMYDLRLSLALEMPLTETSIEPLVNKNNPTLVREKKRNTWSHAPTVTRFDLTRVLIPRESKNKAGKKIVTHDKNYEIELEIDTIEVFNAMDKIQQGTDRFRFEELVEIFVNNARVLNNRVTKLALP